VLLMVSVGHPRVERIGHCRHDLEAQFHQSNAGPDPLGSGPPWRGENPVGLGGPNRYLVVVHAVWDGKCALFDTATGDLTPFGEG